GRRSPNTKYPRRQASGFGIRITDFAWPGSSGSMASPLESRQAPESERPKTCIAMPGRTRGLAGDIWSLAGNGTRDRIAFIQNRTKGIHESKRPPCIRSVLHSGDFLAIDRRG